MTEEEFVAKEEEKFDEFCEKECQKETLQQKTENYFLTLVREYVNIKTDINNLENFVLKGKDIQNNTEIIKILLRRKEALLKDHPDLVGILTTYGLL